MDLTELLSCLPFYEASEAVTDIQINSIEMNSKEVINGSLFVCIKGFTVDGHDFASEAANNGAAAVIAEKRLDLSVPVIVVPDASRALAMLAVQFFNNPTNELSLIGITGTNGKTTVTYLLEAIFNKHNKKTGLIGTIQMKIGDQPYPISNTTPDALALQNIFKKMVDQEVDQAIMEVSSHALNQGRVFGTDFDVAVFTNLSQDHLDYHKDMDDYLRAKSLLFAQLGNSYQKEAKYAILNKDDSSCGMLEKTTAQHVLTYGCDHKADVMAENIRLHIAGTSFTLNTPKGSVEIKSSLIGKFNIYNMLAASSAALVKGVPLSTIKRALEGVKGIPGRFEPVMAGQSYGVIIDYAHTPDSLENVLETIQEFAKGKVYVVVGCGGDRDRSKRPLMAQVAVNLSDKAIFTSDNPRTEDPAVILNDMISGLDVNKARYDVIQDRQEAINQTINNANSEDVILIAGKGHETYQEIGRVKYDFDDFDVAVKAIESREK